MMLNNIRPIVSVFSIADTPSRRRFSRPVRELSYFIRKESDNGSAAGITRPFRQVDSRRAQSDYSTFDFSTKFYLDIKIANYTHSFLLVIRSKKMKQYIFNRN